MHRAPFQEKRDAAIAQRATAGCPFGRGQNAKNLPCRMHGPFRHDVASTVTAQALSTLNLHADPKPCERTVPLNHYKVPPQGKSLPRHGNSEKLKIRCAEKKMHASGEVGRFQMVNHSSPPRDC